MKSIRTAFSMSLARGADGVEFAADGITPTAFRLWRFGDNPTDKDPSPDKPVRFTLRSAALVRRAYDQRGLPLRIDYDHQSLVPTNDRRGPEVGIGSGKGTLGFRGPENEPEPWIENIEWTPRALAQIHAKERSEISPYVELDRETREVTKIVNVALCFEGATLNGVQLAAARDKGIGMDDLISRILAAITAGDYAALMALADEASNTPGAEGLGTVLKAICAEEAKEPAEPPMDAAATKLAAGIAALMAKRGTAPLAATRPTAQAIPEAFTRELTAARAEGAAALHEARTGRVEGLIAANRDLFDPADERQHLKRADPETTREYIDSMKRKQAAGTVTLAASRAADANPSKAPPAAKADDADVLNEFEQDLAKKNGISPDAMKQAKARVKVQARNGAGRR